MSSENQKADLSSLRINRNIAEPNGRSGSGNKLMLYSMIGGGTLIVVVLIFLGGGMSGAVQVETAIVTMTYPSQANAVLTASGYVVAQRKAARSEEHTSELQSQR